MIFTFVLIAITLILLYLFQITYGGLLLALILIGLASLFTPTDSTDKSRWNRSGLILYTDHATGVQYVKGGIFGGTTVRVDKDGNPYIENKQNKINE